MIRHPLVLWLLLFVVIWKGSETASAEEWPQFRGPNGNGLSTAARLPVHWGPKKNVSWKIPLEGEGWSSPIAWKGRIYLTAAVPPAAEGKRSRSRSLRALCFDAKTGAEIWNVEVFQQTHEHSHSIHNKNSHASGTPVTDGKYLYVHFGPQGTACLTLDGETVWKNREFYFDPRHGSGGSPLVAGDLLVFNCDGYKIAKVVALDRFKGTLRWETPRPPHDQLQKFAFCTPVLIEVDGQPQIFSPGAYVAAAYEPEKGRELWRVRYDGFSVVPRPLFRHGLVYMATGFLDSEMLVIDPTGKGDVTDTHVRRRLSRGAPHTPSLLIVGENLYMFSDKGIATCLNAVTGKVYWKKRLPGNYSASPLYAEGKIYIPNETGLCLVLKEGRKYRKLAQNPLRERVFASMVPVGPALVIRGEKHLYKIEDAQRGSQK